MTGGGRSTPAVVVAAVLLALAGCGGRGPIGAAALERQAESLRSGAAEGALLAEDAAAGRTTRTFQRLHSSELADAVAGVESALSSSEAEPGLDAERRRLVDVAGRVRNGLERLGGASGDEGRALARDLGAAAGESERIGASLR